MSLGGCPYFIAIPGHPRNSPYIKEKAMDLNLRGKVAVVTGANGGLGRAILKDLSDTGVFLVAADMRLDGLDEFAREARIADLDAKKLDATSSESVRSVFGGVAEARGGVDILVNCAGITFRHEPLEFPEEAFDRVMAVNVKGTFLCSQMAARLMKERGGGKIVNLASIGSYRAIPNTVAYCASKGAVANMTHALALDLAKYNIAVNAVAPSTVKTPLVEEAVFKDPETLKWMVERIPLGRLCQPRDVAQAVRFLVSPAADFITGHVLPVDGGWLA